MRVNSLKERKQSVGFRPDSRKEDSHASEAFDDRKMSQIFRAYRCLDGGVALHDVTFEAMRVKGLEERERSVGLRPVVKKEDSHASEDV